MRVSLTSIKPPAPAPLEVEACLSHILSLLPELGAVRLQELRSLPFPEIIVGRALRLGRETNRLQLLPRILGCQTGPKSLHALPGPPEQAWRTYRVRVTPRSCRRCDGTLWLHRIGAGQPCPTCNPNGTIHPLNEAMQQRPTSSLTP